MKQLMLATRNRGKVAELEHLLEGLEIEVRSALDYPELPDVVEDGATFFDNARKKAHTMAQATGLPSLADDSGLTVAALDGAPGVQSARYAGKQGDSAANNEKLLRALEIVPEGERQAAFVCTMVLALPDGREWVSEGRCEGEILRERRGDGGFGYDPIFYLPQERFTMAELPMERKNAISHRGQALRQMKSLLVKVLGKDGE